MITFNHVVCCTLMLVILLPYDNVFGAGQRGPYIPKKRPPPIIMIPTTMESTTSVKLDVQGNIAQSLSENPQVPVPQAKGTTDEAMRHIAELENTVTTMKLENVELEHALNSLQLSTITLQKELSVVTAKVTELGTIATQNRELTRLLTYFETFFGVLYSEAPEAFDANISVETRLSRMNTYIGNRDAELAEIRPSPPVEIEEDDNGVSDEFATVVVQLSEENAKLASKVATLEQDVAITSADVQIAKSSKSFGTGSCSCVDDLENRLHYLETASEVLLAPVLASGSASSSPTSKKAGSTTSLIDEETLNFLRMSSGDSRGVSDTRKSVFSAVRHKHMIGGGQREVLSFDDVHVNKGNNFKNNSVFQCSVEGFYFYHFTVRSYDGHYIGVSLLKNGNMMTSVYTDASERSIMQSQSIILHMLPEDEVWLEIAGSERFAVHSDIHKYITISGFLIYKGR